MAKRRVKSNTLGGFWQNIKAVPLEETAFGLKPADDAAAEALENITSEVNASSVPASMTLALVEPYFGDRDEKGVEFVVTSGDAVVEADEIVRPVSRVGDEGGVFKIDVLGLLRFARMFAKAAEVAKDGFDDDVDFRTRRQTRFLLELTKLPDSYLIYLALLQEVAYANEVVSVEDREGKLHDSEVGFYLSLLWAFKEFERFYLYTQNRHLRADYGIVWHEGEWVAETARGRGYVENV